MYQQLQLISQQLNIPGTKQSSPRKETKPKAKRWRIFFSPSSFPERISKLKEKELQNERREEKSSDLPSKD
jgi:hypothetical protein